MFALHDSLMIVIYTALRRLPNIINVILIFLCLSKLSNILYSLFLSKLNVINHVTRLSFLNEKVLENELRNFVTWVPRIRNPRMSRIIAKLPEISHPRFGPRKSFSINFKSENSTARRRYRYNSEWFQSCCYTVIKIWIKFIWVENDQIPGIPPIHKILDKRNPFEKIKVQ